MKGKKALATLLVAVMFFSFQPGAYAGGIPVIDLTAYFQRLGQFITTLAHLYLDEYLQNQQIYQEERGANAAEKIRDNTSDLLDLYEFTLQRMETDIIERLTYKAQEWIIYSPPARNLVGRLSGKEAQKYQEIAEGTDAGSVEDIYDDYFKKLYWDVERLLERIEKSFPEPSEQKEEAVRKAKVLGIVAAKSVSAESTAGRIRNQTRKFNKEVLPAFEGKLKSADSPTKIAEVQAIGIKNLQSIGVMQNSLLAKLLEVETEILNLKGEEYKSKVDQLIKEKKILGVYGRKKEEYKRKVRDAVKDFSKLFTKSLTGEK